MVKKIFPIFLHAGSWSFLIMNLCFSSKLVSKMNEKKMAPAWRNFKNIFFTVCTWPNRPVGAKILPRFQIEGKTDVWISQVRRVKTLVVFATYSRYFRTKLELNNNSEAFKNILSFRSFFSKQKNYLEFSFFENKYWTAFVFFVHLVHTKNTAD